MGQRFQGFINMHNFSKAFYADKELDKPKQYKDKLPEYMELMMQKKKDDGAFGNKDNCILGAYHQWLYGRSAPLACLNVLDFLDGVSKNGGETNPFSPDYCKYYRGISPIERVKTIMSILSIFRDKQLQPYTRSCGVEKFSCLNIEDKDEHQTINDFSIFDNNDGIFIIDALTKKYCFINISEQDIKNTNASALPSMHPSSAMDYIEAYYPSTMTPGAKAHIKWLTGKENRKNKTSRGMTPAAVDVEIQKEVMKYEAEIKANIKINAKFAKRFKKYKVLTLAEVKTIFPDMRGLKDSVNTDVNKAVENINEKAPVGV